uniref:Uncharacterized protein n=1 Tax=Anguilla anguilla TaxID=7936 RepID=A0A0E9RXF3_ANGAN
MIQLTPGKLKRSEQKYKLKFRHLAARKGKTESISTATSTQK